MAKAIGLIGNLKGKIGNTVFATRRGTQIARVYQPEVHNPKSARQELSRMKMKKAVETLKPFAPQMLKAGLSRSFPTYEFQRAVGKAIPVDAGIITGSGSYDNLVVSAPALAAVMSEANIPNPFFGGSSFAEAETVKFNANLPQADFLGEGGSTMKCGIVVAIWSKDLGQVLCYHQDIEEPNVDIPVELEVPTAWTGIEVDVYAFAKQIPEAVNGIQSAEYPWMYPAKTSATVYVAHGTIA